jgi:hypothetical protein
MNERVKAGGVGFGAGRGRWGEGRHILGPQGKPEGVGGRIETWFGTGVKRGESIPRDSIVCLLIAVE